ncbi:MAG: hypothetical protein AB8B57_09140 [Congregibacter sp.]
MLTVQFLSVTLAPILIGLMLATLYGRYCVRYSTAQLAGYGLILGMLSSTVLLRLLHILQLSFHPASFLLACVLTAACATAVLLLGPRLAIPHRVTLLCSISWETLLLLVCISFIAARLVLLAEEALVRPLSGWDVTMHWATKAKVWLNQGSMVPFVDNQAWLTAGDGVFTDHHPDYPTSIPLLQVWMGLALGGWSETVVSLPWVITGTALLLLFFGGALVAGASPVVAVIFTYLLASLPLLGSHIAIAGYADLLLGAVYLAALQALLSWSRYRDRASLLLLCLFALAAPTVKNEGLFWTATLLPGVLLVLISPRKLRILLLSGTAVLGVFALLAPADFTVAGHSLERMGFGFRSVAPSALAQQIFIFGSWHLTGILLLLSVFLVARYPSLLAGLGAIAMPLAAAVVMYLFLFTATRFSYGAIHGTASNRIALHLIPSLLFLVALLAQRYFYRDHLRSDSAAS